MWPDEIDVTESKDLANSIDEIGTSRSENVSDEATAD